MFEVNGDELLTRLSELPDEINAVLKHFDGKRSVLQIIDRCDRDDLETLTVMSKLFFEGLIYDTGRRTAYGGSIQPGRTSERASTTSAAPTEPAPQGESATAEPVVDFGSLAARVPTRTEPGLHPDDAPRSEPRTEPGIAPRMVSRERRARLLRASKTARVCRATESASAMNARRSTTRR